MASILSFFSNIGQKVKRYVKKNIVLPIFPDLYKGDVKLDLAKDDISFAQWILLDADQRKNLSNAQKIQLLKIINEHEPRGPYRAEYQNVFWESLEQQMCLKRDKKHYFPRYIDLIDNNDDLETQKNNAEKLFDMGLLELKMPAANPAAVNTTILQTNEHVFITNANEKVRLAKLSTKLAEAICLKNENCGDENVRFTDQHNTQYNLSKTQRAEIMDFYCPRNNPQPVAQPPLLAVDNPSPAMGFWEKLLNAFIPKNANGEYLDPQYQYLAVRTDRIISDANNAIQNLNAAPLPALNRRRSSDEEQKREYERKKAESEEQQRIISRAKQEKEIYLTKPDSAESKAAALLHSYYYLYKNLQRPANNVPQQDNNSAIDYKLKFLEILNYAISQQINGNTISLLRQTAALILNEHLLEILPADIQNNAHAVDNSLLQQLPLISVLKLFEFSDHNHPYNNQLWKYIRIYKINHIMANEADLNLFTGHLAKTDCNQSAQFLTTIHDKCNIFIFITKLKQQMNDAKYNGFIKLLSSLVGTDLLANILYNNYANADVIHFLNYLDTNKLCPDIFENIVKTLFVKYSKTQLSELLAACKDNAQLLQLYKKYLQTAGVKIDYNDREIATAVMSSNVASSALDITLNNFEPLELMRAATDEDKPISDSKRREYVDDILNAASKDGNAAVIFAYHEKSCALAKESLVVANYSFTKNQNTGMLSSNSGTTIGFFNDLKAKHYVVVKLQLTEENKNKIAKILHCAPVKLQNSLFIFPNNEWKSSFQKLLSERNITLAATEWSEVHSYDNRNTFSQNPQFLNLTTSSERSPLNILVPLPNPQYLLSIYKNLKKPKETPFYQVAYECHHIIDQILSLGSAIKKSIRSLFIATDEFQNIKFEAPKQSQPQKLVLPESKVIPAAVVSAPASSTQELGSNKNNPAIQSQGSAAAANSVLTDFEDIESIADSIGKLGAEVQQELANPPSQKKDPSTPNLAQTNGVSSGTALRSPAPPEVKQPVVSPRSSATTSAPASFGAHRRTAKEVEATQNGQSPLLSSAPSSSGHATTSHNNADKRDVAVSPANLSSKDKQTPERRDVAKNHLSDSSKKSEDSLKLNVISDSIKTIKATYDWYSEDKKQLNRLEQTFNHINTIIQRSKLEDIIEELHDKFLKKLEYNQVAQFLILNKANHELFILLSTRSTTLSRPGAVLTHAARESNEVLSIILGIKDLKDFCLKIIRDLSIERLYDLLDMCWDNEMSKNILIEYISSLPPIKITALRASQSSLANKLFSNLEVARNILKDKFIDSAVAQGNEFIDAHYLDLLRNVKNNKTEAKKLFQNYYFSEENLNSLTIPLDTAYVDLDRNYQSFFNEKRIQKAPFSVVKLIFTDERKKQLAATLLHCTVEQLDKSYLLFSNNDWKKEIMSKLKKSNLVVDQDFIMIELLRNDIEKDTLLPDQETKLKLVTNEDYITKDLNGGPCSILVPYPHALDFVTLFNIKENLKFYSQAGYNQDALKAFHNTKKFITFNLDSIVRLAPEILKKIFGDDINNERVSLMEPDLVNEYKTKYESSTRSFHVPGMFRTERENEELAKKQATTPARISAALHSSKLGDLDTALSGPSAAINKLMQQNLFDALEMLRIITTFSDNPIFISCLNDEKLWNPKIDVYKLALAFKDIRSLKSEDHHKKALELIIECKHATSLITTEQLKDLAKEYIKTFGDISEDYKLLGLDSRYVTAKSMREFYKSFNKHNHVDKSGDAENYKKKQSACERLMKIYNAKDIIDEDPDMHDWRQRDTSSSSQRPLELFQPADVAAAPSSRSDDRQPSPEVRSQQLNSNGSAAPTYTNVHGVD